MLNFISIQLIFHCISRSLIITILKLFADQSKIILELSLFVSNSVIDYWEQIKQLIWCPLGKVKEFNANQTQGERVDWYFIDLLLHAKLQNK